MKNTFLKARSFLALSFLSIAVYSCTKEVKQQQIAQSLQNTILDAGTADLRGRNLAANCFQCHGTNGHGKDDMSLAGEPATDIISEINEMKLKNPGANIMNVHAQAYTSAEVQAIANFFSRQ